MNSEYRSSPLFHRPAARLDWRCNGQPNGSRLLLTSAQFAEMRRKLADVDAKLRRSISAAEEREAAALTSPGAFEHPGRLAGGGPAP